MRYLINQPVHVGEAVQVRIGSKAPRWGIVRGANINSVYVQLVLNTRQGGDEPYTRLVKGVAAYSRIFVRPVRESS